MLQFYKYKSNFAKYYICVNTLNFSINNLIAIWNFSHPNGKVVLVNPNLFGNLSQVLQIVLTKKGTIRSVE